MFNDSRSRLILQSEDDVALITEKAGMDQCSIRLIRSAGVDLEQYAALDRPAGVRVVMLAPLILLVMIHGEARHALAVLSAGACWPKKNHPAHSRSHPSQPRLADQCAHPSRPAPYAAWH